MCDLESRLFKLNLRESDGQSAMMSCCVEKRLECRLSLVVKIVKVVMAIIPIIINSLLSPPASLFPLRPITK